MRRVLIHILSIIILLCSALVKGKTQRFNYSFEHFTTDNGLSHESVLNIIKDKDGFIWIGTANGLNRFDGVSFKVFLNSPDSKQSIPGNYIAGITLDKKGYLWVSTNNGLCRIDTRTLWVDRINLKDAGETNSREEVMYGEFDSKGKGWFIVNQFLYVIDQDNFKWKRYSLPANRFHANMAQIDSKDRIWVNIGRAKYSFDRATEKFTYIMGYDTQHKLTDTLCGVVKEDAEGKLWMNTWDDGFYIWNDGTGRFESVKTPTESTTTFEFDTDEQGRPFIWCGGGIYGLMAYDTAEKHFYQFKNDPRDRYSHNLGQTTAIFRDTTSGIVWLGTENGLEKYDRLAIRFHRYRIWQEKDELTNSQYFFTSGFVHDKTDPTGNTWWVSVWIGGVYKWNRGNSSSPENFEQLQGIKQAGVFSLIQAHDGKIWVGHGLGAQVFDPKTGKFIRHFIDFFPSQTANRTIFNIIEDADSNIWLVSHQGLFSWQRRGDSIINWSNRIPFLKGKFMPVVQQDADGFIWGTTEKGLMRIDPKKNEALLIDNNNRKGKKLPDDYIGALHIDKSNHLWISGVSFLAELDSKGEVINIYTNKNGYIGTSVFNIVEDQKNFIWVATDNKLHRLNPSTGHFDHFDKSDGLSNNKIGDGCYISDEGELFLGFNGAMCSINTNEINFNNKAPVVFPSRVMVKGQLRIFDDQDRIVIKPGERNIILEFAALNYSQSTKNRFAFWLEGYDSTWRQTSDRILQLMNLEAGNHKLHVKASNNDGVWSGESIYILKVVPTFRQTIWFRILIICLMAIFGFSIYLYRKQQRKRLEKIRNRIATDLHDDMGSTLSSIRIFSDVAKKQIEEEKPETVQLLDRISNNATSLSENMQDIIWTIRSDNDTLEDLVSRMREFGLRVCDAKNIRFNIRVSQSFKASKLSLEQRRNLYLIFRESLNNAVKYAECTKIDLILNQKGRYLKMELNDNGNGFEKETVKRGNGLNNLEKRAKEINGQIEITSAPGKGTNINIMVTLFKRMLKN